MPRRIEQSTSGIQTRGGRRFGSTKESVGHAIPPSAAIIPRAALESGCYERFRGRIRARPNFLCGDIHGNISR